MAYFAGLLEGMLTAEYIYQQYHNTLAGYCVNETDYCGQLALFLERNQQYMSKMMAELDHEPFWYQVATYNNYIAIYKGLSISISLCDSKLIYYQELDKLNYC